MQAVKAITLWLAASAMTSIYAAPQGGLAQEFKNNYQETVMDGSAIKVSKPGSTLVVQQDGVLGNPVKMGQLTPFGNTFENGALGVTQSRAEKIAGFGGIGIPKKHNEKPIASGAKVYLVQAEFQPGLDFIALTVQSCGDCDPKAVDPAVQPLRAKITFKFLHGGLAATDFKHVQQTIEQVLKFPDKDGGATGDQAQPQQQQQAPAPQSQAAPPPPPQEQPAQQQFAPIAAPPAPPAPPRQIKLGMTLKEVKDGFGEPASIVDLGSKVIYKYPDLKVTFVNGKVTDVE